MFWRRPHDREGRNPIALLATIILAPIAAMLIQVGDFPPREFDADAGERCHRWRPAWAPGQRAQQKLEAAIQARAARRQSGHGAHVHHQPFSISGLTSLCSARIRRTGERIQALLPRPGRRPLVARFSP